MKKASYGSHIQSYFLKGLLKKDSSNTLFSGQYIDENPLVIRAVFRGLLKM